MVNYFIVQLKLKGEKKKKTIYALTLLHNLLFTNGKNKKKKNYTQARMMISKFTHAFERTKGNLSTCVFLRTRIT